MDTIQHNPAKLYKCNETGITIVQHKHMKMLWLKRKRQISSLQSVERGSLVTAVNCMSPSDHFIPLLLVFPRKKIRNKKWWMTHRLDQSTCVIPWVRHRARFFSPSDIFISSNIQNPTKEVSVIFVQDGHYSHTSSLGGHNFSSREPCWVCPTASQDGWKKFLTPAGISSPGSSSP